MAHIAGFVAAFGTGPSGEHLINFDNNQRTHRPIGLTSIARRDRRLPAALRPSNGVSMASLTDLMTSWGSLYANHAALRTLVEFVHVSALIIGGGLAIVSDRALLSSNTPMTIASTAESNSIQKYGTSLAPIRPMPWKMPLTIRTQPSKRTIATDASAIDQSKQACDHHQNALKQIQKRIAPYCVAHRFSHGRSSGIERKGCHIVSPKFRLSPTRSLLYTAATKGCRSTQNSRRGPTPSSCLCETALK